MLSPVQKNIGATVVMGEALAAASDSESFLPMAKTLFDLESPECDSNVGSVCFFGDEQFVCSIEKCPLGAIVREEFLSVADSMDTSAAPFDVQLGGSITDKLLDRLMKG